MPFFTCCKSLIYLPFCFVSPILLLNCPQVNIALILIYSVLNLRLWENCLCIVQSNIYVFLLCDMETMIILTILVGVYVAVYVAVTPA